MKINLVKDIAFYGIQGSGKTTQAEILVEKTNSTLFYLGKEIRKRMFVNDEFGREISTIIDSGKYLNGKQIKTIFEDFFTKNNENDKRIVYDVPVRNLSQKPIFDEIVKNMNRDFIIIYLRLDEKTARNRIGGQTGRNDLSKEAIDNRINLFYKETVVVIEKYRNEGIPVFDVDASGSIEEVARKVEDVLK